MVAMNVWPTDASDGSVANEARWRKMARHWAPTGVADNIGLELAPTLAFPNLTVRNGAAWVDGHYCELLSDQVLTVTANGLAVVRFDPAANLAELVYRDGVSTPAQSPTGVFELPIAKITGSALTDQRRFASIVAAPKGVLSWNNGPLADTGFIYGSTPVEVAGLAVAFDAIAGRAYKVTTQITLGKDATAANNYVAIADAANAVQRRTANLMAANGFGTYTVAHIFTAATTTIGLNLKTLISCNAGAMSYLGTTGWHAFMLAEDLGPYPLIPTPV